MTEGRKMQLQLKSNDGQVFKIDEDVAFKSNLLKKMVSDLGITDPDSDLLQDPLPVTNVDGETLQKIIDWCTAHRNEVYKPKEQYEDPRITLTKDDEAYMDIESEKLLNLLLGANYLDIPGIMDIVTQKIANMANGKTVEEIREIYGLVNDFTNEEEEEIKKRFAWVEQ